MSESTTIRVSRTIRDSGAEVPLEPDARNRLSARSAAQCQHIRSISVGRALGRVGNVGPVPLWQIRDTLEVLFDL